MFEAISDASFSQGLGGGGGLYALTPVSYSPNVSPHGGPPVTPLAPPTQPTAFPPSPSPPPVQDGNGNEVNKVVSAMAWHGQACETAMSQRVDFLQFTVYVVLLLQAGLILAVMLKK